ncbi:GLPGLI family protein [Formosa haliotis]|uniref:GLPGLI family protein n=1 Tax=Formosa haliotis TaxID=1555194 RepID=UPI000825885F|nr:GLPGLI family protein [Formosa haliotis]
MKYNIIIFLLTLSYQSMLSQVKTGVVYYGEIQSLSLGSPVGKDYNATLLFDTDRSLYTTRKDSLEQLTNSVKQQQNFTFSVSTNNEGFLYYNDLKTKTFFARDLGFSYVKEDTPIINWDINDKTKLIGDFECQMATCSFRGRTYTAWFTMQVPLPYGPWKLQGLPGLILEAYDTNKEIFWYFKELKYPSSYQYLLKPIKNPTNTWITFDTFKSNLEERLEQATLNSRILSEKTGVPIHEDKNPGNIFIEVFGDF